MVTRSSRDERIELRTTSDEKRLLSEAAAQERLDVTAFVLRAALPAAREALARAERLVLSERESAQLLDLLEHPPAPTPALIDAARRHLARG